MLTAETFQWKVKLEEIAANRNVRFHSGGITLLSLEKGDIQSNNTSPNNNSAQGQLQFQKAVRAFRTISEIASNNYMVLILLPFGFPPASKLEMSLNDKLNLPLMNPMAVRNRDKYVIFTNENWKNVATSEVIRKLKYKLIIPDIEKSFYQFCPHCPVAVTEMSRIKNINNPKPEFYFHDFQRNYFGTVLKLSVTNKLPGSLKIWTDQVTGVNQAKRGVYAIVLTYLAKGLNFTYEVYGSSGGGSTGHMLQNGMWIGGAGDVFNTKVDFGLVSHRVYLATS